MTRRTLVAAIVCMLSAAGMQAQTAKVGEPVAGSKVAPAEAIGSLVDRFEREITRAANAMPAEKYEFTPASLHLPGAAFYGVRTFAGEIKHVAQANYSTAENIDGAEPQVDRKIKAIGELKTKDEILAALAASFVAVHKSIATITAANQNDAVEDVGVGANQSKESLATWVAVHGYDHYGQIVEYLRMNGIVP